MISEKDLASLSYSGAPKIVTEIPGPKSQEILEVVPQYESLTRPGGASPLVFDEGMGETVKDPDGNIFIDLAAGVAVNSVGRRHPRVVQTIENQIGKLMHATEAVNHNQRIFGKGS